MTQSAKPQDNSSRSLARARRKAMSGAGKAAIKPQLSKSTEKQQPVVSPGVKMTPAAKPTVSASISSGRAASVARRQAMSVKGKTGMPGSDRTREASSAIKKSAASQQTVQSESRVVDKNGCGCGCGGKTEGCASDTAVEKTVVSQTPVKHRIKRMSAKSVKTDSCRAVAVAKRKAQSVRGKAGISKSGMSSAQTARASNPGISSRDLARALREQKSRRGNAGQKKSVPTGRMRPARKSGIGSAQDAPWKVGASNTSHGQTVTGSMVGRSHSVTGDEASTCRDITGTEYLGADIFKDFCQSEPAKTVLRGGTTATALGNGVTGNRVGRSNKVTGDEPGTCKNVTGTEYVDAGQSSTFCGTSSADRPQRTTEVKTQKGKKVTGDNIERSGKVTGGESGAGRVLTGTQYGRVDDGKAPSKVGSSATLSGGTITGTMVGRNKRMTGDEPGSCRNVTGDDYIGQEQFKDFCKTVPERSEQKVGQSKTFKGEAVTGSMAGRSAQVTGNEPGTCKAVTGTPYAGAEQYKTFCESEQSNHAKARMQKPARTAGAVMTGLQPSVGGTMTGDSRGACETVSGTPYVGRDQMAEACPSTPAEPGSPDFPQMMDENIGADFSVTSPAKEIKSEKAAYHGVTGSRYEQGSITGPFGMAPGKVTGTEEARFDQLEKQPAVQVQSNEKIDGRQVSRITGEGMDAGPKITGDDWERGDRVTGTEGASSMKRNPTLRGPVSNAMTMQQQGRDQEIPVPVSKVTGGSGNTDRGALITYSGGARG